MKPVTILCATLVALTFALSSPAQAKVKTAGGKQTKGKIVSIATDKSDPTLTDIVLQTGGKKNAQEVTLIANKSTVVEVDGKAAPLANLTAGEKVKYTASNGIVTQVTATTKAHHKKASAATTPPPAPAASTPATSPA